MGPLVWTKCGPRRILEANNFATVCRGSSTTKQFCLLRSSYTPKFVILLYGDHADIVPGAVDTAAQPENTRPVPGELWRANLCLAPVPGSEDQYYFPCIPTLHFRFQNNHLVDVATGSTILSILVNTSGVPPFLRSESLEFTGIHVGGEKGRQIVCATKTIKGTAEASTLSSCLQAVALEYLKS